MRSRPIFFVAALSLLLTACAAQQPASKSQSAKIPPNPATTSQPTASATAPASQPTSAPAPRFADEIAAFEKYDRKNTPPPNPVLFVGSSSIVGWPTATSFPNLTILNRGFGGSTLPEVNHYFDRIVTPYHPRLIVLYAGDNDIAIGATAQEVLASFRQFVANVRKIAPTTPIIYLSNKPSPSRTKFWPTAREANTLIAADCAKSPAVLLRFVDIATPMLNAAGAPRPELFLPDQLHMKDAGYELWTRTLMPVLEDLLASNFR